MAPASNHEEVRCLRGSDEEVGGLAHLWLSDHFHAVGHLNLGDRIIQRRRSVTAKVILADRHCHGGTKCLTHSEPRGRRFECADQPKRR